MIIGENRNAVIENIKSALASEEYAAKVETGDPVLTTEQCTEIVDRYLHKRKTVSYRVKSYAARRLVNVGAKIINRDTELVGIEKLDGIKGGAFITSNHFNPLENTAIRTLVRKLGKKRLNIVSQITNFAMSGVIGYLMNYADTIPISANMHYTQRELVDILGEKISKNEFVLIYPEQEMWFNYRKPRPIKRGAYYYAAKLNAPVISCFVEMQDMPDMDNESFHKVKYIVHVLDVLYPDQRKSVRENSTEMCERDYRLKKQAYESAYGKALTYDFDDSDIAGWIGNVS